MGRAAVHSRCALCRRRHWPAAAAGASQQHQLLLLFLFVDRCGRRRLARRWSGCPCSFFPASFACSLKAGPSPTSKCTPCSARAAQCETFTTQVAPATYTTHTRPQFELSHFTKAGSLCLTGGMLALLVGERMLRDFATSTVFESGAGVVVMLLPLYLFYSFATVFL
jgi:hypothetical protein